MLDRCYLQKHSSYSRYGAKGIKVCEEWHLFENFLRDMGESPKGLTLDRIDSTKDYRPDNCRWATYTQQNRNRSTTRKITFNGETRPAAEWAEILGVDKRLLRARLDQGWDGVRALTAPKMTLNEAGRIGGINRHRV